MKHRPREWSSVSRAIAGGIFAGVLSLGTLAPNQAWACAGCSNPHLPSARGASLLPAPGEVSASLGLTATTMKVVHSEACPDIGPICDIRDEPAQLHDQRFYVAELRPVVDVGLSRHFGVEVQVPLRLTNTGITFRRLDGAAFEPDYENIHHRDETLTGFGDPWLSGRAAWIPAPKWSVSSRLGLSIPLGRTEENPFARGRAGLSHQHIQFGTGTFNPVAALDVRRTLGKFAASGYGQAQLSLYENRHGYRAGNRFLVGASADVRLGRMLVGPGVDLLHEEPERWDGLIQQDGNVGRTDLLLSGTVSYGFGAWTASLSLRAPVWQRFLEAVGAHTHDEDRVAGQLTYPGLVGLTVHHLFGGT